MALSNEQLAAPVKGKDKGKSASHGSVVDTSITFDRNIFIDAEGAGKVNRKGEKVDGDNERVKFSSELRKEYTNFLNNYMKNLGETKKLYPHLFKKGRELELKLLEQLTENNEPSKEKINNFLLTPEAWMITTQIMERQMAHKLFALGLTAAINPAAKRVNQMGDTEVVTRIDEGVVRGFMRDKIAPHYGKIGKIAAMGGAAGVGALGFAAKFGLNTTPEGAAAGAALLALSAGINSLRKGGLTIDVQQSADALKYLKSDPEEAEFLLRMNHLDVNNFDVVSRGGKEVIEEAPGVQTNLNTRQTWEDVMSTMYARQSFYEALGQPARDIDALPEQFLFNYDKSGGQMEQTGARWEARLSTHYDANRDIRDRGVAAIPAIGGALAVPAIPPRSADHPDFDSKDLDVEGNLKRLDKARREVMLDMVQEHIAKVVSREAASDSDINTLTARAAALKEGGPEHAKKIAKIDERILELKKKKEVPDATLLKVAEYQQARKDLKNGLVEYAQINPVAAAEGKPINQAIIDINLLINNPTVGSGSIFERKKNLGEAQKLAFATEMASIDLKVAGPPPMRISEKGLGEWQTRSLAAVAEGFKQPLEELVSEKAKYDEQIEKLRALQEKLQRAESVLQEKGVESISLTPEDLGKLNLDYAAIRAIAFGTSSITDDDLRTKSVHELMAQVNAINLASGGASGWLAADNPSHSAEMENAIVEARSRSLDQRDYSPATQIAIFNEIIMGVGVNPADRITSNDLVALSDEDLLVKLTIAKPGGYGWNNSATYAAANRRALFEARQESRHKMITRTQARAEWNIGIIDTEIEYENEKRKALKFDKEAKAMELTGAALGRRGEIYAQVFDDLTKLTDVTALSATSEGVTPAEIALALPAGYYKIAEMIFNYQAMGENRQKSFEAIAFIMPPDKLAAWLNDGLELKMRGTPNLTTVLTRIQSLASRNQMPSHRLYAGIVDVMGKVRNQAMAITI